MLYAMEKMLHEIYPELEPDELATVSDSLDRYLEIVCSISKRLEANENPQSAALTENAGTLPCTSPQPF